MRDSLHFLKWQYKHLKMHTTKLIKLINYTIKYIYIFLHLFYVNIEHCSTNYTYRNVREMNGGGGGILCLLVCLIF